MHYFQYSVYVYGYDFYSGINVFQALFMTDNSSVDAAASWVLDNQHLPDLDEPFKVLVQALVILLCHLYNASVEMSHLIIKAQLKTVSVCFGHHSLQELYHYIVLFG